MKYLAFGLALRRWTNGDGGTLTPHLSVQYSPAYDPEARR